jgi:hypothetical protein
MITLVSMNMGVDGGVPNVREEAITYKESINTISFTQNERESHLKPGVMAIRLRK